MTVLTDNFSQSIDFVIPDEYTKIGINVSGGADSSLLLLVLAQELIDTGRTDIPISVTTCANDVKHRWNVRKAQDVINYVIDKTGTTQIDMHYSYYRDKQDSTYFHKVEHDLFDRGVIDIMLSGITANPLSDTATVENSKGVIVDLQEGALAERNGVASPVLTVSNSRAYYDPFVNVDKRFIADMYTQYNAMDLFDLTRSCEAIPKGRYDPTFEQTACGQCWWCLERKWAFGRW